MTTQTDSTITVYARDMYAAQGVTITSEQRAALIRRAQLFRNIITVNGGTAPAAVTINVPVRHPDTHAYVGNLEYRF